MKVPREQSAALIKTQHFREASGADLHSESQEELESSLEACKRQSKVVVGGNPPYNETERESERESAVAPAFPHLSSHPHSDGERINKS